MKYFIPAFLFGCLLTLAACQNNATGDANSAPEYTGKGAPSTEAPSNDPNKLTQQILTDFLAARAFSLGYKPTYEESLKLMISMKMTAAPMDSAGNPKSNPLDAAERAKVTAMVEEVKAFHLAFSRHYECTESLDSLTTQYQEQQINTEDAQKKYAAVRTRMSQQAAIMVQNEGVTQKVRTAFDQAYPDAVK